MKVKETTVQNLEKKKIFKEEAKDKERMPKKIKRVSFEITLIGGFFFPGSFLRIRREALAFRSVISHPITGC